MNENSELSDKFQRLRNKPILKARQTVVQSLNEPSYAFKYLERRKKDEFGDNIDITTGGESINQILDACEQNTNRSETNG